MPAQRVVTPTRFVGHHPDADQEWSRRCGRRRETGGACGRTMFRHRGSGTARTAPGGESEGGRTRSL